MKINEGEIRQCDIVLLDIEKCQKYIEIYSSRSRSWKKNMFTVMEAKEPFIVSITLHSMTPPSLPSKIFY